MILYKCRPLLNTPRNIVLIRFYLKNQGIFFITPIKLVTKLAAFHSAIEPDRLRVHNLG